MTLPLPMTRRELIRSLKLRGGIRKCMHSDQALLFDQHKSIYIGAAAKYPDIKPPLDIGCKIVANMITGESFHHQK